MSDRAADGLTVPRPVSPGMTARELFKNVVQYMKCELTEMRETAIVAFGHANELAFRCHSHCSRSSSIHTILAVAELILHGFQIYLVCTDVWFVFTDVRYFVSVLVFCDISSRS